MARLDAFGLTDLEVAVTADAAPPRINPETLALLPPA
jgi:hypothetical protein